MPSRSVLSGLRDSLNRHGRLFGHPGVASNADMQPLLAVLRGELSQVEALTPELEELVTLGLIETRPLRLYQISLPSLSAAARE